jgi:hypothetical protein
MLHTLREDAAPHVRSPRCLSLALEPLALGFRVAQAKAFLAVERETVVRGLALIELTERFDLTAVAAFLSGHGPDPTAPRRAFALTFD